MAFHLATLHFDTHGPQVIEGTIHANLEHFLLSLMHRPCIMFSAASHSFTYTDHIFLCPLIIGLLHFFPHRTDNLVRTQLTFHDRELV